VGNEDPRFTLIENQLNTLQRDYDNAISTINQLEVERDNALYEIKKFKLIVTDIEQTYCTKELQYKSNIKRLCDKLLHYTISINERKMVESILNCTFDGTEIVNNSSNSNPYLNLKNNRNNMNNNMLIYSNKNSPARERVGSSSFFNNSSS